MQGGNGNDIHERWPEHRLEQRLATGSTYGAASAVTVTIDGAANDGRNCPGVSSEDDNVGLTVENVEGTQQR